MRESISNFVRGTLQNAVGCVIAGIVLAAGSAFISYAKTRQMSATILLNAVGVFLLTVGACILVWWLYGMVRGINVQSRTAMPQPQRLTIRIVEGYFGVQRNSRSTQIIILRVKVDGPAATVTNWKLSMQRNGEDWKLGYINRIKNPIQFEEETAITEFRRAQLLVNSLNSPDPFGATEQLDPIPEIDVSHAKSTSPLLFAMVPEQGWLIFNTPDAGDRFPDLIFTSVFILTAFEDNGPRSICNHAAGEWLHRALINFP